MHKLEMYVVESRIFSFSEKFVAVKMMIFIIVVSNGFYADGEIGIGYWDRAR